MNNWGRREFDIREPFGTTYWVKFITVAAVGALLIGLSGCASLPPNTAERLACVAAGGTWNETEAKCEMPPPPVEECPAAPTAPPVCTGGEVPDDPAWTCGKNTDWEWVAQCTNPEPICKPNTNCGCYVKAPGEDWTELKCGDGQQCQNNICVTKPPQCPATCPEGQYCTDPAKGCVPKPVGDACNPVLDPRLSAPSNEDSNWVTAANQDESSEFKNAVWDAVRAAQVSCPAAWTTGGCMKDGPSAIDKGYLLISKELQKKGIAASQARTTNDVADHLWIRRSENSPDWNATKLFFYGNGCLITGDGAFNVHGWYSFVGDDPTPPPVDPTDPPGVAGCSDPLPPKVWTAETLPDGWGENEIGQPRWEISCGPHSNVVDCTAKVAPRACDYCESIGMGEFNGQPRCGCPVRNECPGFKCEERVACEAYLTGGTKLESRNGAVCEFAHNNPFQFWPNNGNCRLCSVGDPRVCGGWF